MTVSPNKRSEKKTDNTPNSLPEAKSSGSKPVVTELIASPDDRLVARNGQAGLLSRHRVRRYLRWTIGGIILVLLCLPVGLWINYRLDHVMSRNAMVRSNLTEIGTRLSGVLGSISADEGEQVVAGQVMARLEDRHIRSEIREAQAELDGLEQELSVEQSAIAHVQKLLENKLQTAEANLSASKAEVAAAQSRADDETEFYEVRKLLLDSKAISREAVREANGKRRTAVALLRVAKANQAAAQSAEVEAKIESEGLAVRRQRISVLSANVMRAKARLARAKVDLESSSIRAPDDGSIVRWLVKLGGPVEIGKPIVSMVLGKDVWIEAWIDEDEISRVHRGSEATVTLQSFPDREFSGVVDRIGLTTDFEMPPPDIPQPRFARMRGAPVVGVLIRLRNPTERLLPGLSAVVAISDSEG